MPAKFRIRLSGGEFQDAQGDLGTGGVLWRSGAEVADQAVDLQIPIPGMDQPLPGKGRIIGRRKQSDGQFAYQIQFTDMTTDAEMAIARYLDEIAVGWE